MGSTNHGNQDLSYNFYEELSAQNFNKRNIDIQPRGIYKGGYLTRVSDAIVTLSPLTVEIGDGDIQVSISTAGIVTLEGGGPGLDKLDSGQIDSAHPYLVLRWAYAASSANYMEIHALALSNILSNDIIIGKCNFSGGILSETFDYSNRTFLNVQNLTLKVEIDDGGGTRKVRLRAGKLHTSTGYIIVPSQLITLDNPTSNSRIDLIYVTVDGVVSVAKGAEAATPVAPSYGGKLVLAEVKVVHAISLIPASQIVDVRSFITPIVDVDDVTIERSSGKLQIKDGGIGAIKIGNLFGSWTAKNTATVYQAVTDGFVTAYTSKLDAYEGISGYSDGNNPPTILRAQSVCDYGGSRPIEFISFPVRKNDFWKVTVSAGETAVVQWLPMGS